MEIANSAKIVEIITKRFRRRVHISSTATVTAVSSAHTHTFWSRRIPKLHLRAPRRTGSRLKQQIQSRLGGSRLNLIYLERTYRRKLTSHRAYLVAQRRLSRDRLGRNHRHRHRQNRIRLRHNQHQASGHLGCSHRQNLIRLGHNQHLTPVHLGCSHRQNLIRSRHSQKKNPGPFGVQPSSTSASLNFGMQSSAKPASFGMQQSTKPGLVGMQESSDSKPVSFGMQHSAKPGPVGMQQSSDSKPGLFGMQSSAKPASFGMQSSPKPGPFGMQPPSQPTVFGAQPPSKPAFFGTQSSSMLNSGDSTFPMQTASKPSKSKAFEIKSPTSSSPNPFLVSGSSVFKTAAPASSFGAQQNGTAAMETQLQSRGRSRKRGLPSVGDIGGQEAAQRAAKRKQQYGITVSTSSSDYDEKDTTKVDKVTLTKALQPSCESMCPEKDYKYRSTSSQLSFFECNALSRRLWKSRLRKEAEGDRSLAVKKFKRSDAGSKVSSDEIRPIEWLLRTLYHILHHVLPCKAQPEFENVAFVRDRLRSIRQDLT
eukprot:449243_1